MRPGTTTTPWGAIIDERLVVDQVNAWLYWWLIDENNVDDEGLTAQDGTVAKRAFVLGQYSRFVRPGFYRIGATHVPQSGVSVSAYRDAGTNRLTVIATNYTSGAVTQSFEIVGAPHFTTMTPTQTSGAQDMSTLDTIPLLDNSFVYVLPPQSITTQESGFPPGS